MSDESCWEDLCLQTISNYWWSLPLEIFLFLYSFIGLAIACDDFLVKSLETLAHRWDLKEDVAGAQFMAIGSAAPEIIISDICVIKGSEHTGLGMGAILGSGMIANMLVPAAVIFAIQAKELRLKRRPFLRDILFYSISLGVLVYIVHEPDGSFDVDDASVLLAVYVLYVLVLQYASKIRKWYRQRLGKNTYKESFVRIAKSQRDLNKYLNDQQPLKPLLGDEKGKDQPTGALSKVTYINPSNEETTFIKEAKTSDKTKIVDISSLSSDNINIQQSQHPHLLIETHLPNNQESNNVIEEDDNDLYQDMSSPLIDTISDNSDINIVKESQLVQALNQIWSYFIWPLKTMFRYTCIDCELDGPYEKYYLLTFLISVTWVAFFSFIVSSVVSSFVSRSGIANDFFGVTLVALSAEIPDTVQSIAVARRGFGSMAVGNFMGSQVLNSFEIETLIFSHSIKALVDLLLGIQFVISWICNICIGIGLPYFISAAAGKPIQLHQGGINIETYTLTGGVIIHFLLLLSLSWMEHGGKAILNRTKGAILFCSYIVAMTIIACLTLIK